MSLPARRLKKPEEQPIVEGPPETKVESPKKEEAPENKTPEAPESKTPEVVAVEPEPVTTNKEVPKSGTSHKTLNKNSSET